MRLAWLIFALLVVLLVFVPVIVHSQALYVCSNGICSMSEEVFRALIQLASGRVCA